MDKLKTFMSKVNGRHKAAERKDAANLIGKPFKCTQCENVEFVKHVTFGEVIKCSKCKGIMKEVIQPM